MDLMYFTPLLTMKISTTPPSSVNCMRKVRSIKCRQKWPVNIFKYINSTQVSKMGSGKMHPKWV